MKIEFSLRKSIGRHSAKLFTLILTLSLLALVAIQAASGFYQARESDEWRNQVHEVLGDTEESFARFRAMRQEAKQGTSKNR
jgi:Tfp pilus assembly protein FimT